MTRENILKRLNDLKSLDDKGIARSEADFMISQLLTRLGCGEIAKAYGEVKG